MIVSSGQNGAPWLAQFFSACSGCNISFIPLHYYGDPQSMQSYIEQMHNTYPNYPLWITEFGYPGLSDSDTLTALNSTLQFLDGASYIARYSYFPMYRTSDPIPYVGAGGAVMDANGQLTDVGQLYLGSVSSTKRTRTVRRSHGKAHRLLRMNS